MRNGIVIAGHACVDVHKEVTGFPGPHDLCNIESVNISLGGLVSNCGRDLARLDAQLPVYACARIGVDGYGDEVLKGLSKYKNIDTSMIRREGLTSFTDVLSNIHTRERSFLSFAGTTKDSAPGTEAQKSANRHGIVPVTALTDRSRGPG